MDYTAHKQAERKLTDTIRAEGAGAGTRWNEIAMAAMTGHAESIAEVERLLSRPAEGMADYWLVMSAAQAAMIPGEQAAAYSANVQRLNAGGVHPAFTVTPYLQNRVGTLRRAAGLTQEELARKAGVKVSTLQKIENGTIQLLRARTDTVIRLAGPLGVTVEGLVGPVGPVE